MLETIKGWITTALEWLLAMVLWLPLKLYGLLCEGVVAVLNAIPVPSWLSNVSDAFGSIPPGVSWFLGVMQFGAGLAIIGSAYLIRFLIRRIPFFG